MPRQFPGPNMHMKISVVIPTYNRSNSIARAIESVLGQGSPANEIIVVDDGSTDHSTKIIRQRFPGVTLIEQNHQGVSAARNRGIRAAQYDWIALLDSDDEWLPHKLETIRAVQRLNRAEVLFHSDEVWIRNGVRVNPMQKHAKYGGMIFERCLPLCVISPSAAVIHASVFARIGLFNESLPACEDYDLWLRLCHRQPVFYIDQPLINKYGGHRDQLSRQHWGLDRYRIRALHALIDAATLSDQQRRQTRDMLKKKLRIVIEGARKHDNQQVLNQFLPLLEYHQVEPC